MRIRREPRKHTSESSARPPASAVSAELVGPERDDEKRALFDEAGGQKHILKTCRVFYAAIDNDDRVSAYFKYVDNRVLVRKMALMVSFLLGGVNMKFRDSDKREITWQQYLTRAHWKLRITDRDYEIVCIHLMHALIETGHTKGVTEAIGAKLVAAEPLIVQDQNRVLGHRIEDWVGGQVAEYRKALEKAAHAGTPHANAEVISRNIRE